MLRLPAIQGIIRRRLLVNFRVDPEVIQHQLPAGFEPKLQDGQAIAGICLIRLEEIRPGFMPLLIGVSSENAAHRVAVIRSEDSNGVREGVYIPQRHTSSWLVLTLGGRLFPGQHKRARFTVRDDGSSIELSMQATDDETELLVHGKQTDALPTGSAFPSVEAASKFFRGGAVGYSATASGKRLEALKLETPAWSVAPIDVSEVYSSWFNDPQRFPSGSVEFDCALIMRNIAHRWIGQPDLYLDGHGSANDPQHDDERDRDTGRQITDVDRGAPPHPPAR